MNTSFCSTIYADWMPWDETLTHSSRPERPTTGRSDSRQNRTINSTECALGSSSPPSVSIAMVGTSKDDVEIELHHGRQGRQENKPHAAHWSSLLTRPRAITLRILALLR